MTPRIVVLGGSFAGLSAAFKLKRELGDQAEVTVVSRDPRFVFIPSLIWVVPGWRKPGQISFDLGPALRRRGIGFTLATAARILPAENKLVTDQGEVGYDYLLIATGPKYDWAVVPNFGPADGTTWSVCNLPHAMEAAKAWLDFVQDPGPVVIGSTQGASCFGAEYEVAFNIDRALRQAKIRRQAPLTFFTAEPFLGHFGIGGMRGGETMLKGYFKMLGIEAIANVSTTAVEKGRDHAVRRSRARPQVRHRHPAVHRRAGDPRLGGAGRRPRLRGSRRPLPAPRLPQHLRRRSRRAGQAAAAHRGADRRAQDGLDGRGHGQGRCPQHCRRHHGWSAKGATLRRHPPALHHGRRQPGHDHRLGPRLQAAQVRDHDPGTVVALGQARLRALLHDEDEVRPRAAALTLSPWPWSWPRRPAVPARTRP